MIMKVPTYGSVPSHLKDEYDSILAKMQAAKELHSGLSCAPGHEAEAAKLNVEIAALNEKLVAAGVSSLCLPSIDFGKPEAQEEPVTVTETESKLVALGLHVWTKGGRRRIYVNREDFGKVFGLEIWCYKTGNISDAYLKGEKISNSKAYQLLGRKTPYYDCLEDKWVNNNLDPII